jgi:(p)ppGpp synthase/HD superfamily hydrolase
MGKDNCFEGYQLQIQRWIEQGQLFESKDTRQLFLQTETGQGNIEYHEAPPEYTSLFTSTAVDRTESHALTITRGHDLNDECANSFTSYEVEAFRVSHINLLFERINPNLSSAIFFAANQHAKQFRKYDNQPYIVHLTEVMHLVEVNALDVTEATLIASVLHDVVEDTHVNVEGIALLFGNEVSSIVAELTCESASTSDQKKQILLDKIKTASEKAKLIKLADITSNIRTIPKSWTIERKNAYINWCDNVALECKKNNQPLYDIYLRRRSTINAPKKNQ